MMVRDECDIIRSTIEHTLGEVDEIIVADNGSVDGTREILESLPVHLVDDPDPAYRQSQKMTALAQKARLEFDADWVVPIDADELWYGVRDLAQYTIIPAQLQTFVCTTGDDLSIVDPVARMRRCLPGFLGLPKVMCRPFPSLVIEQGNHGAHYGYPVPIAPTGNITVSHYPVRSVEQWLKKIRNGVAALNAAPELDYSSGAHWRDWGKLLDSGGVEAVEAAFNKHWVHNPTECL